MDDKKIAFIICQNDEPDVGFYPADFDIGFICSKNFASAIIVAVNARFDTDAADLQ